MKTKILIIAFLIFQNALYSQQIQQESVGDTAQSILETKFFYYEDKTASLGIDQILSDKIQNSFIETYKHSHHFGHTESAIWIKIILSLKHHSNEDWLLEIDYPLLDNIDLYLPDSIKGFKLKKGGDKLQFNKRDKDYRNPVFNIGEVLSSERIIYLRFESTSALTLPIIFLPESKFEESKYSDYIFLGVFVGVLLIMIIYSLFLTFFAFKEYNYLYFTFFIISYSLYQFCLTGFAFQYLWPNSPEWGNIATVFFMGLSALFLFKFSQLYLNKINLSINANRVINYSILFFVLCSILSILKYEIAQYFLYVTPVSVAGIILPIGFKRIKFNYSHMQFFILALLLFTIGSTSSILNNLGYNDSYFLGSYGLYFIALLEIILLGTGLTEKFLTIKKEREKAQEESLKNHQKLVKHLQESERVLEHKVEERTKELNEANTKLKSINETLIILNKEKEEFLGIAAHDLRNPLTAVKGYAEIIVNDKSLDEETRSKFLNIIIESANRMFKLIKNLLDTNKLESGILDLNIEDVKIINIIKEVIREENNNAIKKEIDIKLKTPDENIILKLDKLSFRQIIENLISNAVKYSPHKKEVIVTINSNYNSATISVSDNGPGLTEEDKKKMFGKFARLSAKPTAGESSVGLGLSIVKKLVDLMNGKIWCESELNNGTTFYVKFVNK